MTAVRARFTAYRNAAYGVALLSQLQGTVSGPMNMVLQPHAMPVGRQAAHDPNPLRGFRLYESISAGRLNNEAPAVVGDPFFQTQWPNPLKRPSLYESVSSGLLDPSVVGDTLPDGQHSADDQPNPRGYPYPTSLRTWTQSAMPPSVQLRSGDWPNPRGYPYPQSLRAQFSHTPLSLANPSTSLPSGRPAGDDQPNPRGYPFPVANRSHLQAVYNSLSLINSPLPSSRHAGDDQPNPRGYPFPVANRGHVHTSSVALLTSIPIPDGRIGGLDQPNPPRGASVPIAARGEFTGTPSTLVRAPVPTAVPSAGAGNDHPNPQRPRQPVVRQVSEPPLALLETPATVYVVRAALVTRYARRRHVQQPGALPNLQSTLLAEPPPVADPDDRPDTCGWGNPPPHQFPSSLRTHTVSLQQTTLQPPDTTQRIARPPLVIRYTPRVVHQPRQSQNLLQTTLGPAPPTMPTGRSSTLDQPNPTTVPVAQRILSWTQSPFPPPANPLPILPFDWPNPQRAKHPVTLRTTTVSLLTTTLAAQDNFPDGRRGNEVQRVPRGPIYPVALRTIAGAPFNPPPDTSPDVVVDIGDLFIVRELAIELDIERASDDIDLTIMRVLEIPLEFD